MLMNASGNLKELVTPDDLLGRGKEEKPKKSPKEQRAEFEELKRELGDVGGEAIGDGHR